MTKITATAAVVGAIVGEFVASQKGLGYIITTTQSSMNTSVAFAALDLDFRHRAPALRRRRVGGALVGAVGRGHRLSRTGKGKGRTVMTRTIVAGARRIAGDGRQRLGAGEIHLRIELVRRRRPRRLLGGARQGLLQGQGPRRHPGELQGLGRFDRQGRHRPRRCRSRRRRRGDRLGRPRHHHQDGRHGVRQDAAQHLQPQEQPARQAQGPRGQDAGRASGRQPAPDVPGLRQGRTASTPPRSPG